ncbi:hypothetical protein ACO2Q7_16190 [Rathayibacter sp. KR2-224]|uniref:hypothetical protein n=1 Tax=Rathayibacter sp. KR2-224 TaxID=3400913 RepID=UPI003C0D59DC
MVGTADGKPKRFWFDPRFAVGILLIVASVVGVCALLAAQNRNVQVYVARSTLVAGDAVSVSDVELVNVRVPDSGRYLAAGHLPEGATVVRSVPKGELVPASAVAEASATGLTSIVVKASGPVAASITAGATADVWAAHAANDNNYKPPAVLVAGAVVVSVSHDDALVADRGSVSVELRIPAGRVASVLQAIADGQVISVVSASTDAAGSESEEPAAGSTPAPTGRLGGEEGDG